MPSQSCVQQLMSQSHPLLKPCLPINSDGWRAMSPFAVAMLLPMAAMAEKWAVIAAGSQGFMNYRHQADACHAYQIMLKSGVKAENIILMMQDDGLGLGTSTVVVQSSSSPSSAQDDVAKDSENPFPGQLFNKPGNDSPDVTGAEQSADVSMDVEWSCF